MHIHPDLTERLRVTLPNARAEAQALPGTDLRLYLLNADYQQERIPPEVQRAVMERPAYWAFCWPSGLWLAQRLRCLRGMRVLDFGCGSGVAAVAAARAGAEVWACDLDPDARAATLANAALNGVTVRFVEELPEGPFHLILATDVFYDAANLPLLPVLLARGRRVLIADSRLREVPPDVRFLLTARAEAVPPMDIGGDFGEVQVFVSRVTGGRPAPVR